MTHTYDDAGGQDLALDDGPPPEPGPVAGRLAAGAAVAGGRYHVVGLLGRGAFGEVYRATDRTSGGPVALRLLHPDLLRDASPERLRAEISAAGRLDHKNIARTLDFGVEQDLVYVVTEHVDGQTLRALLGRKRAAGAGAFSMKGAYNVVAHVCNALAYAHKTTIHGALSASNVLVNKAGRVKLTEFGFARALPAFVRLAAGSPEDLAAMPPEIATRPREADARADLYATGAILYELLTGRAPSESFVRPSQLVAGLPPELDQVIARCLAPQPSDRIADAMQLKGALHAIVEARGPAGSSQGMASASIRQAAAAPAAAPAPAPAAAAPRPSAQRAAAPSVAPPRGPAQGGGLSIDESEEKWLVQKNKLDFGPFNFAQIKDQIAKDDIVPGNVIIDNESGQRCRVEDHPLLSDMVHAAAERRDHMRRAHAEVAVVKQDKRKGLALYAFIGVGVIALGGGTYFAIQKLRHADKDTGTAEQESLGGPELKVAIQIKPPPPRKPKGTGGGSRSGGSRSGGGPGGAGFDDPLDLGDAEDGEESEVLDTSQINPVLVRHGNALGRCLLSSGERRADIEFLIKGATGKVYAVKVNGSTSSGLAKCIGRVMAGMSFPTFNGPRTRASFDMSI